MNLAEVIYEHSLRLPEPAAREALDFRMMLVDPFREPTPSQP